MAAAQILLALRALDVDGADSLTSDDAELLAAGPVWTLLQRQNQQHSVRPDSSVQPLAQLQQTLLELHEQVSMLRLEASRLRTKVSRSSAGT